MKVYYPRRTLVIEALIGVNSGYNHENEKGTDEDEISEYAKLWDVVCEECAQGENPIPYYPITIVPARAVYKKDWGCPPGGEKCILVTATINPIFTDLHCKSTFREEHEMSGSPVSFGLMSMGKVTREAEDKVIYEVTNLLASYAKTLGNETVLIQTRYVDAQYIQEMKTPGVIYPDKKEEKS